MLYLHGDWNFSIKEKGVNLKSYSFIQLKKDKNYKYLNSKKEKKQQ